MMQANPAKCGVFHVWKMASGGGLSGVNPERLETVRVRVLRLLPDSRRLHRPALSHLLPRLPHRSIHLLVCQSFRDDSVKSAWVDIDIPVIFLTHRVMELYS